MARASATRRAMPPDNTAGSLIIKDGKPVGSRLIGQNFSDPGHFWGRPSATTPMPYNAANSSGSNLGPSNPVLQDAVRARIDALRAADPGNLAAVPVDLVTASASGLDPHISVAAALYPAPRIARARHISAADVRTMIEQHREGVLFGPFNPLGLLGEPRVNVLALNLALDARPMPPR